MNRLLDDSSPQIDDGVRYNLASSNTGLPLPQVAGSALPIASSVIRKLLISAYFNESGVLRPCNCTLKPL